MVNNTSPWRRRPPTGHWSRHITTSRSWSRGASLRRHTPRNRYIPYRGSEREWGDKFYHYAKTYPYYSFKTGRFWRYDYKPTTTTSTYSSQIGLPKTQLWNPNPFGSFQHWRPRLGPQITGNLPWSREGAIRAWRPATWGTAYRQSSYPIRNTPTTSAAAGVARQARLHYSKTKGISYKYITNYARNRYEQFHRQFPNEGAAPYEPLYQKQMDRFHRAAFIKTTGVGLLLNRWPTTPTTNIIKEPYPCYHIVRTPWGSVQKVPCSQTTSPFQNRSRSQTFHKRRKNHRDRSHYRKRFYYQRR